MKKRKTLIIILTILLIAIIGAVLLFIINKNTNTKNDEVKNEDIQIIEKNSEENNNEVDNKQENSKIDIIDVNSKTRPYAIVINNTPIAVKVQTGLNKAYLVYEFPTEGNTSRLMALYKDVPEDVTIGTIRSARHNFIDYALESDAIFVHFGWSRYAQNEEKKGIIDYINGLFDTPFWRNNPENLASEHTAYTSLDKIKHCVEQKQFKTESDSTILLKYNPEDIDLSNIKDAKSVSNIVIKYDNSQNITSFEYDSKNKVFYRKENGNYCIDYNSKEKVNTKNIIIQKVDYDVLEYKSYWDLKTIGSGKGYFITNGYYVPITWKKESRSGKTKYYYNDGKEIEVSDGRTYIEIQTNKFETVLK